MSRPAKTALAVMLAVSTLLLTGCFKMDMDLQVKADDTIDGTIIIAFDKSLTEQMGGETSTDEDVFTEEQLAEMGGEVKVEPYDEGDFLGQKVTFSGADLAKFSRVMSASESGGEEPADFSLTHEGDQFIFEGAFDMRDVTGTDPSATPSDGASTGSDPFATPSDGASTGSAELDEAMSGMMEMLMASAEMRVSITFPGEITDTNGETDGNTVTWKLKIGEANEMRAVANDSGGGSGLVVGLVVGGVAVLIALGLGGFLLLRRRNAGSAEQPPAPPASFGPMPTQPPPPPPTASPDPMPTQPPPVAPAQPQIQPGWYPTADGQTLRYHDGNDWTEQIRPAQG